ncbi:hypothetical protein QJQ45_008041 [Haematococcus lacustris]|nr:hypothetical protein QJQ45_008041 [Haematococcus lacustris]
MHRIGESRWRPLELCWWPEQGALPAKGKEYPGLGYKRLTAVTAPTSDPDETDGAVNFVLRYMCNHCQDNLAGSNKDRLKRHLLRCSKFLASTQAMNIAKTFSEIAAAIEEYKQENKEVAELQQDAGTTPNSKSTARAGSGVVEDKGRFAKDLVKLIVDCNLPFNIVDNPMFKTFLATWVPAMPVPSRDHDGWSRTQGSEHLLGFCAALPGGSSVFLDVVLTQDHSVTSDFMLAKITQILEKHNLPSPAQPSPAQPSPAQPSPAQPSPAQPSPALA